MGSSLDRLAEDDGSEDTATVHDGYQPPLDAGSGRAVFAHSSFSGPMPPASELLGYKAVDPALPHAILEMAQKEQAHRHQMDNLGLQITSRATSRGQYLGAGVAVAVLLLAAVMALLGQGVLAAIIAGVDVVGLAAVFVGVGYVQRSTARSESSDED